MPRVIIDNRYKILKKCGSGATGNVYKVTDLKDNRMIALKILSNEKAAQRFKREFKLLAGLRHPHLCSVYDFGTLKNGRSYFTMELVNGDNIFNATQGLSNEKIYPWIVQLCRVLEYIHSKGLIHYDIKPSNVLIAKGKEQGAESKKPDALSHVCCVKLMDFGLAGEQRIKGGALIKGTFPYIAPEVIKGVVIDHRADLYSLGVLLYELFTRRAFQERKESFTTILQQQIDRSFEPVAEVDANIPDNLERLIVRLLSFEPATRFSRANEVIREINKLSCTKFKIETEKTLEGYLLSSKFVGRDKEMSLLKSLYEKARQGEGKVVLVTGNAGIGKSRLLKEFKIFAQLKRSHCFVGYAYQDRIASLGPFFDIFNELINFIEDSEFRRSRTLKLSLAVLFKMFPDLMDAHLKKDLPKLVPLEPDQEKLRNFGALSELIAYGASVLGELVILLEDLHWADDLSIQFLEYLGRNIADRNIFICGTSRKEELANNLMFKKMIINLRHEGFLNQIELSPLRFKSLYSFLDSTITPGSNSFELVRYLMKKTGGNPFFVEEIMRTLLRKRNLSIGEKVDIEDLKQISIPGTIEDAVLKRIEDLDVVSQKVVKFASVFLKGFNYDMMKQLTALGDTELSGALWELRSRQILFEEGNTYRFYHTTLGETVYKRLGDKERSDFNYQVGKALEKINRGNLNKLVEDVAFYFINAKDRKRGVKYGLRAAEKSSKRYANEQAIHFYKGVLGLLDNKESRLRFTILEKLSQIEFLAGLYDEAIKHYYEVLRLKITTFHQRARVYKRIGDIYRMKAEYRKALMYYKRGVKHLKKTKKIKRALLIKASIHAAMAFSYQVMGNYENAAKFNANALRLLKGLKGNEAMKERSGVIYNIGVTYFYKGDYDAAILNFKNAYKYFRKIKDRQKEAQVLNALGYIYSDIKSNFKEAHDYYQRSMQIFNKIGNPDGLSSVSIGLGALFEFKGDYVKSLECFHRAISISKKIANKRNMASSFLGAGSASVMLCDYKKAEEYLLKALNIWKDVGKKEDRALAIARLGDIYNEMGEYTQALRFYRESFKISKEVNEQHNIASLFTRFGLVFINVGDFLKAKRYIEKALKIVTTLNIKIYEVQCYMLLCLINIIIENFAVAENYHKMGMKIIKEVGLKSLSINFLLLHTEIYYSRKKYLEGIKIANKLLKLAKERNAKDLYVRALMIKAKSGFKLNVLSNPEVIDIFGEAVSIAEEIGCPEILWKVYFGFGEFLHENKEYRKALIYYQKCIMVFRNVVGKIKNESYKKSYLNRPDRRAAITIIKTKSKIHL